MMLKKIFTFDIFNLLSVSKISTASAQPLSTAIKIGVNFLTKKLNYLIHLSLLNY